MFADVLPSVCLGSTSRNHWTPSDTRARAREKESEVHWVPLGETPAPWQVESEKLKETLKAPKFKTLPTVLEQSRSRTQESALVETFRVFQVALVSWMRFFLNYPGEHT